MMFPTIREEGNNERSSHRRDQQPVLVPALLLHNRTGNITQNGEGILHDVEDLRHDRATLEVGISIYSIREYTLSVLRRTVPEFRN